MSPEVRRELVIKYLDSALKENKPAKTPRTRIRRMATRIRKA